MKISVTQWIYGNEDIQKSIERLKKYNYDGIELAAEPYSIDALKVKEILDKNSIICTSLCGIYTSQRDLSSSNNKIRNNAIKYLKDSVDMAKVVGAKLIIVVPSSVGKLEPDNTYDEAWNNAISSLKEVAQYANKNKIYLAIEAINRYETFLINNLSIAKKLVKEINESCIKIMADSFHMNIEERNNEGALRSIKDYLIHVHIADNTREAAGLGKIDFESFFKTLKDINYNGSITMEFLPAIADPYKVSNYNKNLDLYEYFTEQSINYVNKFI